MRTYLLRRILEAAPVIIGVSVLVFLMLHLIPGDPVIALAYGSGTSPSEEELAALRSQLGLDRPLHVQYLAWAWGTLQGDLGKSIFWRVSVSALIGSQVMPTIHLALASIIIALLIGIPLGIVASLRHRTWADASVMVVSMLGVAMPGFWLGILLILLFSLRLGWFPSFGQGTWRHLVMPAFALGFASAAMMARLTRSTLLEVLQQDYVRTARAKGLNQRIVVYKHALRNAILPVITVAGLELGNLLGGTVIMETVFARQGIGHLAVQAIQSRDYPLVQGVVLIAAVVYVALNLVVDMLYAVLNPRIRYA